VIACPYIVIVPLSRQEFEELAPRAGQTVGDVIREQLGLPPEAALQRERYDRPVGAIR
jgi:hypothetical protein